MYIVLNSLNNVVTDLQALLNHTPAPLQRHSFSHEDGRIFKPAETLRIFEHRSDWKGLRNITLFTTKTV